MYLFTIICILILDGVSYKIKLTLQFIVVLYGGGSIKERDAFIIIGFLLMVCEFSYPMTHYRQHNTTRDLIGCIISPNTC
jgi:hypothetical protein